MSRHWQAQSEISECGLGCLAICSSILGADILLSSLRRRFPSSQRGMNLAQIVEVAGAIDMQARAIRCELVDLYDLTTPAILHWRLNHFVVLEKVSKSKFQIIDPSLGSLTLTENEVSQRFSGVAVEISTAPAFKKRKEKSPLNIWSLLRFDKEIKSALGHGLFFSFLLQFFVLLTPFFLQLAIDEAATRKDGGLLTALAFGFGFLVIFNVIAEALRTITVQRASALMSWDVTKRLFHHMLRLPLTWFHRRKLADAMSRFDSVDPIRQLLTNGLLVSLLDSIFSVALLILMFVYSPVLAGITLTSILLFLIVRLVSVPKIMRLGIASLLANISENGARIETIRAMQSIKTMGGEFQRESVWSNKFASTIRTNLESIQFQTWINAFKMFCEGITHVLIVYFGVKLIIATEMTVGALYAFIAYRQQFSNRMFSLMEQMISWRITELHTDRIADIALTPRELGIDSDPLSSHIFRGDLEVINLAYRYSESEPYILRDVSFKVNAGEFVAISGGSGCGKSTLLKIISGLYSDASGQILIDGSSIKSWGGRVVRQSMGIVMQDDDLLSGSIAENVAFFNESINVDHVWHCLEMAAIATDVRTMPMQLETAIGDMGSTLSGGQKQRILLARALYRNPKILLLDEATANLDISCETLIHETLKSLNITRIFITHRSETLALADRVIEISNGRSFEKIRPPLLGLSTIVKA